MLRKRENSSEERSRQQARYVETLGVAVIALIIIMITLARYGRHIAWSWR